MSHLTYTLPFSKIKMTDILQVGGKNASLGEMIQNLSPLGIEVPDGFAITVDAYNYFIEYNKLNDSIHQIVSNTNVDDVVDLRRNGLKVRQLIREGKFPNDMSEAILKAYKELSLQYGADLTDVAVRSSATAEDLPDASFAGQQETYLNVRGDEALLSSVRNCIASLFTDRAISYREIFNFDHFEVGLSVGIQKMVRSDLASSGVAFSLDTESGFKDVVLINGAFGLGEMVVQGAVNPDEFLVFKPTLEKGFNSIIEKKLGVKEIKMIYGSNPGEMVRTIPVEKDNQKKFCVNDTQVIQIAKWVTIIEKYYTELRGTYCPMDVEWAIDGLTNRLFIVQARPETIHSQRQGANLIEYKIKDDKRAEKKLVTGIAVGDMVSSGKVKILYSLDGRDGSTDGADFKEGDVLVTDMTDPDWEPLMKKAAAIVTNKGGRTCHAAIIAREMGVPAIVGCGDATDILKNGMEVTISCAEGDTGFVYSGEIPFEITETDLSDLPTVDMPIMLNVASPDMAFQFSHIPNSGVGLARQEFIINNYIQVHPLALMKHKLLEDPELTKSIEKLIEGYENEEAFFVKRLSYGIAKIAAAFYPNKVIVRFSDFKSNEYYNMLGGKYFEPSEENPMIGWRGASRYYSDSYKPAFGWECKAIKRVREKMGLDNVTVMIPFCRTLDELHKVYEVMDEYDLRRGENGLEVFLMAELPSNIICADLFAPHIDGFSIGSNDLTQLTLGLDRDSALVAHVYDERNPAVKRSISNLIKTAREYGVKVGICGQGPSDFPDFAEFLAKEGIDSISVTPDSVLKTLKTLDKIKI
jgi:pyruvate,water dikinase